MDITDIELHCAELIEKIGMERIDYLGINLTDLPGKAPVYKAYHSGMDGAGRNHPLVRTVEQRGMLRYLAEVEGTETTGAVRLDIALKQCTDSNVSFLLAEIKKHMDFSDRQCREVRYLAGMKITDIPDLSCSSLCHVGLSEKDGTVGLLKFHFFTRWCDDMENTAVSEFRDDQYLRFLRNVPFGAYSLLAEKAAYLLEKCGGHLWYACIDYSPDKTKYKIYVRDIRDAWRYLPDVTGKYIVGQLERIRKWNGKYSSLKLSGVALALDSGGVPSLNLYFR